MRIRASFVTLSIVVCSRLFAQNSDIESLAGLQFNFGNPGARALGMGGAFLALADDASAAEANPAGLTILRKPEISVDARHYLEQQILTTSGVWPDFERTAFTHNSDSVQVAFASAVYPIASKFTIGAYYHEPLRNRGEGYVVRLYDPLTGLVRKEVPYFWFPLGGTGPVRAEECRGRPCLIGPLTPFISAVDIQQRTWGVAGAWQVHPRVSVGATVRYQTLKEGAFTSRYLDDRGVYTLNSIFVQATARETESGIELHEERDVTFSIGAKWSITNAISVGAAYKHGPTFDAPIFAAAESNGFVLEKQADTTFHVPDIAGLGVAIRPMPALTIALDAVHVTYSNLVDNFYASNRTIREFGAPFEADDVTELRIGAEYFFSTRIPFALRAGYWRDPAHSVTYRGPLSHIDGVAEAILFPEGEDSNHISLGGGFSWPRVQIDFAYDTSERYKVGSVTVVTRF